MISILAILLAQSINKLNKNSKIDIENGQMVVHVVQVAHGRISEQSFGRLSSYR